MTRIDPVDTSHQPSQRDALIEEYLPLVEFLAQRLRLKLPGHVDLDDLVHSGILGLIDAIEKFDASRGIKFKTYAEFRIRGSILDALREMDWVPRSVRKQKKVLEHASSRLEQTLGRRVTCEEICHRLDIDFETFHRMQEGIRGAALGRFVDLGADEGGDMREGDVAIAYVPDPSSEDPYCVFEMQEMVGMLGRTIANLPEKERFVVSLYYFDELTMKEIGTVLGVTESRVSQLHTKAMERLRERIKAQSKPRSAMAGVYAQAV